VSAVNEELVAKLQSEIQVEEDMVDDEDLSANIKEYLENSAFQVSLPVAAQSVIESANAARSRTSLDGKRSS
jgi:complement component 1 Q subcomponent-binding protein